MMKNQYGHVSSLRLAAVDKGGKTVLEDCFFRTPFKVMKPFYPGGGKTMQVIVMSSSAGIMAGDVQQMELFVGQDARMEVTTQSFEKIHKMEPGGSARRDTEITVAAGGFLCYDPLPVIPFAQSDFTSHTAIHLADRTSAVVYGEILSCGRAARGECFQYHSYQNHVRIDLAGTPVYLDNTIYLPEQMELSAVGFFEGYTHLANWIAFGGGACERVEEIRAYLSGREEAGRVCGGVTKTAGGGVAVRLLGNSAQILQEVLAEMKGSGGE